MTGKRTSALFGLAALAAVATAVPLSAEAAPRYRPHGYQAHYGYYGYGYVPAYGYRPVIRGREVRALVPQGAYSGLPRWAREAFSEN